MLNFRNPPRVRAATRRRGEILHSLAIALAMVSIASCAEPQSYTRRTRFLCKPIRFVCEPEPKRIQSYTTAHDAYMNLKRVEPDRIPIVYDSYPIVYDSYTLLRRAESHLIRNVYGSETLSLIHI